MSLLNFNSTWFHCYSEAKLESDPRTRSIYVKAALEVASDALNRQALEDDERNAILVAVEDLHCMEREKQSNAPRPEPLSGSSARQ